MAAYMTAFAELLEPINFIAMLICVVVGGILGAIPGLSGGLGITLILPLTFAMDTNLAFIMMVAMYVGGVSGSFIAAVLLGIPGSAASIGTCYDGYPMTKNGKASKALSIGITASFIGNIVGGVVAILCTKYIADIALMLGPWEYFSLCLMAITLVIGLSNGSVYKGLLSAFFGFFLAMIGADMVTNQLRFTFGNTNLYGGINVVVLLMGTFAVQQVAVSFSQGQTDMPDVDGSKLGGFGLTVKDFTENMKTIVVSLLIGLWIGFLPGMGSGISNLVAYGQAKSMSKHPEKFGTGYEPGVWATECANNAGVGGAIIPMLALGIPGDATTVLLLSGMTIHGLQAGPMFMQTNPEMAALILLTLLVSAIAIALIEFGTKKWYPTMLKAPFHYLFSAILVICFLGAFSSTTSMFSVYLVLGFGAIGVLMNYFGMPGTPMMLAFVLGTKIESYFRMGVSYAKGDYTSFITRPFSLIFILVAIYGVVGPVISKKLKKMRDMNEAE